MELICPSCQQTLRVGDADAGKQARCPKCQTVFAIPGDSAGQVDSPLVSGGVGSEPASGFPAGAGPELWHLRIEDGRSFGPVPKSELDQWLTENRITANCFVRRDQESHWHPAGTLYPQIGQPAGAAAYGTENPFGEAKYSPHHAPAGASTGARYQEPHRGGTILAFGIIGILCCCFFGIAAWIMGAGDLKKIDQGVMDPEGRGLTMAGYVLGIISVILNLIGAGLQVVISAAGNF